MALLPPRLDHTAPDQNIGAGLLEKAACLLFAFFVLCPFGPRSWPFHYAIDSQRFHASKSQSLSSKSFSCSRSLSSARCATAMVRCPAGAFWIALRLNPFDESFDSQLLCDVLPVVPDKENGDRKSEQGRNR